MITKKEYRLAIGIVKQYEKENIHTFNRGGFTIKDLEILDYSISVKKLTEDIFSENNCHELYKIIVERIDGCNWTNVDDAGYLSISFVKRLITDKQIDVVLKSLNEL